MSMEPMKNANKHMRTTSCNNDRGVKTPQKRFTRYLEAPGKTFESALPASVTFYVTGLQKDESMLQIEHHKTKKQYFNKSPLRQVTLHETFRKRGFYSGTAYANEATFAVPCLIERLTLTIQAAVDAPKPERSRIVRLCSTLRPAAIEQAGRMTCCTNKLQQE